MIKRTVCIIGMVSISVLLGGQSNSQVVEPRPGAAPVAKGETKHSLTWVHAFHNQIGQCWDLAASAYPAAQRVRISLEFNRDGTLAKTPVLVPTPGASEDPALAQAAIRSIETCQPYSLLPQEEYVNGWDRLDLTLDTGRKHR